MPKKLSFIVFFSIFLSLFPFLTKGATLYMDPSYKEYNTEDVFIVNVMLNTENENINICETDINFPKDILWVENISNGDSLLSLWPRNPSFLNQEGIISFAGGSPGGFTGQGKLISIIFRAIKEGSAKIDFNNSGVLLNDGLGTQVKLETESAKLTIFPATPQGPKNEWQEKLTEDNIPPEDFQVKIDKIDGKYFAIFSTVDNQSGIDHYEIKEQNQEWKRGNSPYLLENQTLSGKIFLRATDIAGNERISEITPQKIIYLQITIYILILIIIVLICWKIKKSKKKE